MKKLTILIGLAMTVALVLVAGASAASLSEVKKLTASDAQAGDQFGISVALSGDTAVVGANGEDAGGTNAGAAYVLQRDQGGADNWGQVTKLTASDAQANDFFGISVALSGDTAVVGANEEDAGGSGAGAAYVFGPGFVGGIAELPEVAGAPLETGGSSGGSAGVLAGLAGAVAAGAVAVGSAAWYTRRRRNERT